MDAGAKSKINIIFVGLVSLILLVAFIIANDPEVFSSEGYTNHYDGAFAEDVNFTINVTINNTWGGDANSDLFNITHVNITLPPEIVFVGSSNDEEYVGGTNFSNLSTVLQWFNDSSKNLINASNVSKWFSFNATALTPGVYNISVNVYARNGTNVTTNITVTINDTTSPNITFNNVTEQGNYSGTINTYIQILDNYLNGLGVTAGGSPNSGGGYVYLNITNISQDYVNVSRLYNVSNVSGDYYNVTIYTDNYTDGTWVIQVYANDSDGNANNTQNITVRFDQTIPNEVNITSSHVTRGNYSGTQTFNFSILDVTAGGGSLWINISNSTTVEVVRSTINASNPSSIYWNVSVDTSDFVDGLYNVSVTANDSAGNTNTTLVILQDIRIDNTNPTGTVSCSPSTVTAGGGVTCTCSPSDGGSGINTSATINPATSTSNTGTFTQTCTFKDLAGNTGTASSSYTVELSGGSGGGGGGGGSSSSSFSYRKTIPVIADDLKNLGTLTQPVGEKERVKVKIASAKVGEDEVHYIGVRKLTLTSAVVEIASDPVRIELDIGEDAKVDVNDDGFYDVYVKLESITNGKADLLIRYLNEEIPEEKEEESVDTTGEIVPEEVEEESSLMWLWVLIVVIVVIVIGWVVAKKGKR